jgi:GNAT superfamily N-acetyltransferase
MSRHFRSGDAPRLGTTGDASRVTSLLVDAFADDQMWGSSWAFPDPATRRERRAAVFRILVEGALRHSWVWLSGGGAAACLWSPPGANELSSRQEVELDALLAQSQPESLDRINAGFELIAASRPAAEHYYLSLFGSDPSRAGQGIGLRLLRHNLALIDGEGAPAYLETSTALVPVYQRFGFEVVDTLMLPEGPTVHGLWRPAAPV